MARKRYTPEEIIGHLRTIEIAVGKGLGVADACRKLGLTEQTYLSVEEGIWWTARRSGQTVEGPGTGECPAQTPRGRSLPR
jgi:hypothetical protein